MVIQRDYDITTTELVETVLDGIVFWDWSDTYEDSSIIDHRLAWFRGNAYALDYGMRWEQHPSWIFVPVHDLQRFDFDGTLTAARRAAQVLYQS